ncbi:hypothetical protein F0562_007429 [Nyssa sinensis]|uniref:Uncharacterized protein n=1 Tax=Nyssa sinensis TaxID=561372 RepID=A0A5J5A5V3_9ASTE|nr:hypothetical protein F0562_007429 [Nyssa sinensis]
MEASKDRVVWGTFMVGRDEVRGTARDENANGDDMREDGMVREGGGDVTDKAFGDSEDVSGLSRERKEPASGYQLVSVVEDGEVKYAAILGGVPW